MLGNTPRLTPGERFSRGRNLSNRPRHRDRPGQSVERPVPPVHEHESWENEYLWRLRPEANPLLHQALRPAGRSLLVAADLELVACDHVGEIEKRLEGSIRSFDVRPSGVGGHR